MDILLDTHSFLWFIEGDERMSDTAQDLITDMNNAIFLSIASLWEIAIKSNIGKLTLVKPYHELMPEQLRENSIQVLDIAFEDLYKQVELDLHHRDPFDRLLISQAISRELPILTRDSQFAQYNVTILW